jgi:hypothetical protein
MHSDDSIETMAVYNMKRFNAWVRKHERPKQIKHETAIDSEIEQMIASIEVIK